MDLKKYDMMIKSKQYGKAHDMIQQAGKPFKIPEIRVWVHPVGGGDDYYYRFNKVADAKKFIKTNRQAERTHLIAYKGYEINPHKFRR